MNTPQFPLSLFTRNFVLTTLLLMTFGKAFAHCDTMDGPVVKDAQIALEKQSVTPVLKWIAPEDENEIRNLFDQTLKVRALDPDARLLADNYFFESLVRIHRASEGESYTGLKASGTKISPAVIRADQSIEAGDADELANAVSETIKQEILSRFEKVKEAQLHQSENVSAGREYVGAYVEFTHFVEQLHTLGSQSGMHHGH